MIDPTPPYAGVWLPFVTPFIDGELDELSLRTLTRVYAGRVEGFVLGATTGESMALSFNEMQRIVHLVADELAMINGRMRLVIGLHGSSTSAVLQSLRNMEGWPADAFLVTCPHYVRPSQEGLRLHFDAIADATEADLLIYNIPYRTGVNLLNDTLLRLAEKQNIVGVKDCCAVAEQSRNLAARRPAGFSILTGEDASFGPLVAEGYDGGILASAHLDPEGFRTLLELEAGGPHWEDRWRALAPIPELLFTEPSPAALKYCLWRMALIRSPELRLPMTAVSTTLATRIDNDISGLWRTTRH